MLTSDSELRLAETFIAQLTQLLTDAGCGDPAETADTRLTRTLDALADLQTEYRLRLQLSRRLRNEAHISWECDEEASAPRTSHLARIPAARCTARLRHGTPRR